MVDVKEDIGDFAFDHLIEQHRGHRRRRLETDRKKDHLFIRILRGDLQTLHRRIDKPHIRPLTSCLLQ